MLRQLFLVIVLSAATVFAGQEVKPPTLVQKVEPKFSEEARKAKVDGVVQLAIEIDEEGNVASADVLDGPGYGLNEQAVEAVKQWKFKPATRDGKPVRYNGVVRTSFRLS